LSAVVDEEVLVSLVAAMWSMWSGMRFKSGTAIGWSGSRSEAHQSSYQNDRNNNNIISDSMSRL
jgi:hypothetical protein